LPVRKIVSRPRLPFFMRIMILDAFILCPSEENTNGTSFKGF